VLCEKPLFLTANEFDVVRKTAQAANCSVVPVHNWKYAPIIKRATEVLRSGAIGRLCELQITTDRVRDCEVSDPNRPNWRRNPAVSGGGILMDHGWHAIYLALDWFRERPTGLEASLHRPPASRVEDEARLKIEFPSGIANISLTWNAASRRNAMVLVGERGRIAIDDDTLQIGNDTVRFDQRLSHGSYHADWFAAMLPDIVASFRNPRIATATYEEAALCLSLIQCAYRIKPCSIETSPVKTSS
jgi:predicted dehydrogenase